MVLETLDKIILLVNPKRESERFHRLIAHLEQRGVPMHKIAIAGPTWGDELSNETIFQYYDPFCRKGMPVLPSKPGVYLVEKFLLF